MAEVQVCAVADVPENSVISREVGDELVAIYNINGTYYATEARCTHGMADLADGTLMGDEIECRDRKSTRLNSSHRSLSRMPSSA